MLENGTLVLGNSQALGFGPLTTVGNTVVYANGVTISNPIVMTGDTALEVDNADSATQSGVISESGASHSFTKTGTSRSFLTNTNTYSGGTTINSRTLEVDGSAGSGTITISGSELLATTGIANNITLTAGTTNTIATPNGSTETFSGLISGGDVTGRGWYQHRRRVLHQRQQQLRQYECQRRQHHRRRRCSRRHSLRHRHRHLEQQYHPRLRHSCCRR